MALDHDAPDTALLAQLGERLAAWRLAQNLTQDDLAYQAGLGSRTVQRLESGAAATHLSGFLRVCRVLGLLDRVDALIPVPPPSPMAHLKSARSRRRRASRTRSKHAATKKWTWADDR